MSLDVDLLGGEKSKARCTCYVCTNGLPEKCILQYKREGRVSLFSSNITHNLNKMAAAVGIYEAVWRPEEVPINTAKEMIPILEKGIAELKKSPEKYKKLDSPNDWGTYKDFVPWLEEYLQACKEYPEALVVADR